MILTGLKDVKADYQVLITGDRNKTKNMLAALLKGNPDIKTVLCTGQSDTEGAGLAIQENFSGQDCMVAGFDLSVETLRLIKEGAILFSIDQQPYVQGYYPVVQLYQYRRYGIIPSDINAGADVITKDRAKRTMELCRLNYR